MAKPPRVVLFHKSFPAWQHSNVATIAKTPQCLTRMHWNHYAPCLGLQLNSNISLYFHACLVVKRVSTPAQRPQQSQVWRGFSSEASRDGPGKLSGRPHSVIRSRPVSIFVETKYWPNMLHANEEGKNLAMGYGTFMPCESMLVLHSYWGFNGFVDFTTLLLIFASIYGWKTIQLTSSVVSVGQWELAKSRRVNALCEKTLRECHQT